MTGEVKVKSLCVIKYHATKTCAGVDVYLHAFFNSLIEGELSATHPGRFTLEREPRVPIIGHREEPRVGLDVVNKRKNLMAFPVMEPRFLSFLTRSIVYTD
jgi:hypothetical protein